MNPGQEVPVSTACGICDLTRVDAGGRAASQSWWPRRPSGSFGCTIASASMVTLAIMVTVIFCNAE